MRIPQAASRTTKLLIMLTPTTIALALLVFAMLIAMAYLAVDQQP